MNDLSTFFWDNILSLNKVIENKTNIGRTKTISSIINNGIQCWNYKVLIKFIRETNKYTKVNLLIKFSKLAINILSTTQINWINLIAEFN